ncbi:MAG: hypothetical protein AB1813_16210 [Verrucomicrobiota bacterium]
MIKQNNDALERLRATMTDIESRLSRPDRNGLVHSAANESLCSSDPARGAGSE